MINLFQPLNFDVGCYAVVDNQSTYIGINNVQKMLWLLLGPNNANQRHIDYFKLKLLKKQPVQKGHKILLLCPSESRR